MVCLGGLFNHHGLDCLARRNAFTFRNDFSHLQRRDLNRYGRSDLLCSATLGPRSSFFKTFSIFSIHAFASSATLLLKRYDLKRYDPGARRRPLMILQGIFVGHAGQTSVASQGPAAPSARHPFPPGFLFSRARITIAATVEKTLPLSLGRSPHSYTKEH